MEQEVKWSGLYESQNFDFHYPAHDCMEQKVALDVAETAVFQSLICAVDCTGFMFLISALYCQ